MAVKSGGPISYSKPDQQVLFEDIFQNLSNCDHLTFKKKYAVLYSESYAKLLAAGHWAEERMIKRLCGELGIDFTCYTKEFLTGDRETYLMLRPLLLKQLGYPEGEVPGKLEKCERSTLSPDRAAQWLHKELLDHLCREAGLSPISWYRFRNGKAAPREKTLSALSRLLHLTPQEELELKKLVRKDIIDDLEQISPEVQRQWQRWQHRAAPYLSGPELAVRLEDFWAYTAVSPKAMQAFGIGLPPKQEKSSAKSSQGTLLKLTIGFEQTETGAADFLALANSGFYDMRDYLFLTCLYLRLYQIDTIDRILEFYAQNPEDPSSPRLENPYKERRPAR